MRRSTKNILYLVIVLLPAVCACKGNAAGNGKADSSSYVAAKSDSSVSPMSAADKKTDEQLFRSFFFKFKHAVKEKSKAELIAMFNFPLQTLPQWTNDEIKNNPANIAEGLLSESEFPQYYDDIFTKDAIKLIPASSEDDLSEIDKTTTENYYLTLKRLTDNGSKLYEFEKQYAEDNGKETSFGFVFGKVKGAYKVISYYRPWPLK